MMGVGWKKQYPGEVSGVHDYGFQRSLETHSKESHCG